MDVTARGATKEVGQEFNETLIRHKNMCEKKLEECERKILRIRQQIEPLIDSKSSKDVKIRNTHKNNIAILSIEKKQLKEAYSHLQKCISFRQIQRVFCASLKKRSKADLERIKHANTQYIKQLKSLSSNVKGKTSLESVYRPLITFYSGQAEMFIKQAES